MSNYSDLENVKLRLEKIYQDSSLIQKDTWSDHDKIFNKGYLKGIKDTLDMITSLIEQKKISSDLSPVQAVAETQETHPPRLFELSPEEISKIDFQKTSQKKYTLDELTETAFNLENQLLQLFGDVNAMSFDSYTALGSNKLIDIIKNSAGEICRLNKKQ